MRYSTAARISERVDAVALEAGVQLRQACIRECVPVTGRFGLYDRDPKRANALLNLIPDFGQVVVTSARDPDLDFETHGFRLLKL